MNINTPKFEIETELYNNENSKFYIKCIKQLARGLKDLDYCHNHETELPPYIKKIKDMVSQLYLIRDTASSYDILLEGAYGSSIYFYTAKIIPNDSGKWIVFSNFAAIAFLYKSLCESSQISLDIWEALSVVALTYQERTIQNASDILYECQSLKIKVASLAKFDAKWQFVQDYLKELRL